MAKGKIKIDSNRCKGCCICIEACRKNELVLGNENNDFGYPVVKFKNTGTCNACAVCAIVCPDAAIEVIKLVEVEK